VKKIRHPHQDLRTVEPDHEALSLFHRRYGVVGGGEAHRLDQLMSRFSCLPYENLSKILASGPRMPAQVMQQHIELGTGGTCFSLTELLRQLTAQMGLSSHPVMAHMRHGQNIHCGLLVRAAGKDYWVDPGYLLPRPIPLQPGAASSSQPGEPFLVTAGSLPGAPADIPEGDFDLFTQEAEGPRWRYRFSARAPSPEDFLAYWENSFTLPGMRSLLVTRRDEQGRRLYLHNHKLRLLGPDQKTTQNVRQQLERSVLQSFGIDPHITRQARETLDRRRARIGPLPEQRDHVSEE